MNFNTKEFDILKKFGDFDYKMLVKQGAQASVVKLDLSNCLEDIPVLAMAKDDFPFLEAAKKQAGNHPDDWIPLYKKLRREGQAQTQSIELKPHALYAQEG
jgi:type IV secretion system protein VirB4